MPEAVSAFFAMGGYAAYIWPAYSVAAIVLVSLLILSIRHVRRQERELQALRAARRGDLDMEDEA